MRNANVFDISQAHAYGEVHYGVMYNSMFGLVHRVRVAGGLATTMMNYHPGAVVMESARKDVNDNYTVYAILPKALGAVCQGPSHTPKKPKRKPIKGTKPWTKIPYKFEDVEVGDVVKYPCGRITVSYKIIKKTDTLWYSEDGVDVAPYWAGTEAYILKPYKEPVKQEEEVYQIGDWLEVRYPHEDGIFIVQLVQVAAGVVKLITKSGNRLNDVEMLHSFGVIDKSEITKALSDCSFTKLKEKQ